jgi:hypothetical protein
MMQVCSLPAAGVESTGVAARPGTLGVADCAVGAAIERADVNRIAERTETNFMRSPHASEKPLRRDIASVYKENGVYPGAASGHGWIFSR